MSNLSRCHESIVTVSQEKARHLQIWPDRLRRFWGEPSGFQCARDDLRLRELGQRLWFHFYGRPKRSNRQMVTRTHNWALIYISRDSHKIHYTQDSVVLVYLCTEGSSNYHHNDFITMTLKVLIFFHPHIKKYQRFSLTSDPGYSLNDAIVAVFWLILWGVRIVCGKLCWYHHRALVPCTTTSLTAVTLAM